MNPMKQRQLCEKIQEEEEYAYMTQMRFNPYLHDFLGSNVYHVFTTSLPGVVENIPKLNFDSIIPSDNELNTF